MIKHTNEIQINSVPYDQQPLFVSEEVTATWHVYLCSRTRGAILISSEIPIIRTLEGFLLSQERDDLEGAEYIICKYQTLYH